jgi:hypothetical protein
LLKAGQTPLNKTKKPLFAMVDVIEDQLRWLSVCFYSGMISDHDKCDACSICADERCQVNAIEEDEDSRPLQNAPFCPISVPAPLCPVAPGDGTGVGPIDRTGVVNPAIAGSPSLNLNPALA